MVKRKDYVILICKECERKFKSYRDDSFKRKICPKCYLKARKECWKKKSHPYDCCLKKVFELKNSKVSLF